jgi:hypothetical protein
MMNTIRILDWKPVRKNSLLGFCRVEFASGLVIGDITILANEREAMRAAHPEVFES